MQSYCFIAYDVQILNIILSLIQWHQHAEDSHPRNYLVDVSMDTDSKGAEGLPIVVEFRSAPMFEIRIARI